MDLFLRLASLIPSTLLLQTNVSRPTTLFGRLFLKNNLKQPKTTVFSLLYINMIMKELRYSYKGGCSSVDPQKQPENVTVTCTGHVKSGRLPGDCHILRLFLRIN